MADYIELIIEEPDAARRDWLMGQLDVFGVEGFEEAGDVLKAYVPVGALDKEGLEAFAKAQQVAYTQQLLPEQNWNAQWESSFDPVVIGNFCTVRAAFHTPAANPTLHEIIVTPKMSFGTGHHATTYMMIDQMGGMSFNGLRVVDFGTGTGVLAILAEKLGAAAVLGLDNDTWSIDNAAENITRNGCNLVQLRLTETLEADGPTDIILANINRHVLLTHMTAFRDTLPEGGYLLLSGILKEDETVMVPAAEAASFKLVNQQQRGNWLSMLWQKL